MSPPRAAVSHDEDRFDILKLPERRVRLIWKHTSNPAVHELVHHCEAMFAIQSAA